MRVAALVSALLVGCSAAEGATTGPTVDARPAAPAPETGETAAAPATSACLALNECAPPPLIHASRPFRHLSTSLAVIARGEPRHRGRDFFANPGKPQTIIGKFTYGADDKDLVGEEIDIFVQRDCASDWTKIGTAVTSDDGQGVARDNVEDDGGRIYFEVPAKERLGLGRHRIRLVVAGDGTFADAFVDVVPEGTKIFVSDVDGTLTSSEEVEAAAALGGFTPETHDKAPEALRELADKGYRALYLTARPEMLTERTRTFIAERGYPPGLVRTSPFTTGAIRSAKAASFKSSEMDLLGANGLTPTFGFGNKPSDSEAYSKIPAEKNRIFYQIEGEFSGRRIESYAELLPDFAALPAVCAR